MKIFDYEFDENEIAVWETMSAISKLNELKSDLDDELQATTDELMKLQSQLVAHGGFGIGKD